jgi:hypothetical protein
MSASTRSAQDFYRTVKSTDSRLRRYCGALAGSRHRRAGATIVEAKGSQAIYVSQPKAVAELIEKAAKGSSVK